MEFAGHITPDHPAPPTADDLDFAVPIATFVEQSALEELGVGTVADGATLVDPTTPSIPTTSPNCRPNCGRRSTCCRRGRSPRGCTNPADG